MFDLSSLQVVFQILVAVGGASGLLLGVEKIWKIFTGKSRILYSSGYFEKEPMAKGSLQNLKCSAVVCVANSKNHSISITDLICMVKYNKSKHNKGDDEVIPVNPQTNPPLPLNISPNESCRIEFNFDVRDDFFLSLERLRQARFIGFIDEVVPLVVGDDSEPNPNLDPVHAELFVHVDGKDTLRVTMPLYPQKGLRGGTFSAIKIEEMKRDFMK